MTTKIKFSKDFKWALDGVHVHEYKAGETYDVPDRCAEMAVKHGAGKRVKSNPKPKAKGKK